MIIAAILTAQHFLLTPASTGFLPGMTTNCTTLSLDSSYAPARAASGTILFGCGARSGWPPPSLSCSGNCPEYFPAFNVTQSVNYTVVFALPQYYTSLFVAGASGCSNASGDNSALQPLTNGNRIQLSGSVLKPEFYDFCASYAFLPSEGATLPGFTISWKSGSSVVSQAFPPVTASPQPPPTAISVVRGSDNNLYYSNFAGSWSGWQSVGGQSTFGEPVLCSGGSGSLYLAGRGSDNVSISLKGYSNGAWSDLPSPPGGLTNADPACASMNGVIHILVRTAEGGLSYNSLNESTRIWRGWVNLGGTLESSPVLAVSPTLNRLDTVVQGASGSISHMAFTSGAWSQRWEPLNGTTLSIPALSSDGRTLHVVVRGEFGALSYDALNLTSNRWSGWIDLQGATPVAPSLVTDSSGTVHLLVEALDGTIQHKSLRSGGVWSSSWDTPGGTTKQPIAAIVLGSSILIMVSGTNGSIAYNTLTATSWQGWTILGGSTTLEPALSSIS